MTPEKPPEPPRDPSAEWDNRLTRSDSPNRVHRVEYGGYTYVYIGDGEWQIEG